MKLIDLTGKVFGRWKVIRRDTDKPPVPVYWICKCKCRTIRSVHGGNLKKGVTVSCGCYNDENRARINITHGGRYTKEYGVYCGMIQRCENPNAEKYPDYGARGIKLCQHFRSSFQNFIDAVGPRPSKIHSIDRINNEIGYVCGHCKECLSKGLTEMNCRWSLPVPQGRNKRNNVWMTVNGVKMCATEAAEIVGIPYKALMNRLYLGWSHEEALTRKIRFRPKQN